MGGPTIGRGQMGAPGIRHGFGFGHRLGDGVGQIAGVGDMPNVEHTFEPPYILILMDSGRTEGAPVSGETTVAGYGFRPIQVWPGISPQPTVLNANTTSSDNAYFLIPYLLVD